MILEDIRKSDADETRKAANVAAVAVRFTIFMKIVEGKYKVKLEMEHIAIWKNSTEKR